MVNPWMASFGFVAPFLKAGKLTGYLKLIRDGIILAYDAKNVWDNMNLLTALTEAKGMMMKNTFEQCRKASEASEPFKDC